MNQVGDRFGGREAVRPCSMVELGIHSKDGKLFYQVAQQIKTHED
jgi:hypothetical protein